MTKQEKFDNATRLFDLAQSKAMPKSLLLIMLNQVITLGPELGVFSEAHFKKFVEMFPKTGHDYYFIKDDKNINKNNEEPNMT